MRRPDLGFKTVKNKEKNNKMSICKRKNGTKFGINQNDVILILSFDDKLKTISLRQVVDLSLFKTTMFYTNVH